MSASGVTSTKQVVIDLKLLSGDATKNIQDLNVKIGNLKAVLKGMKDAGLENTEQYIKLSQVLKEMNQTVKQNEKVLIANINEQKANGACRIRRFKQGGEGRQFWQKPSKRHKQSHNRNKASGICPARL